MAKSKSTRATSNPFPWGPVLLGTGAVGVAAVLLWPRSARASSLRSGAQPPLLSDGPGQAPGSTTGVTHEPAVPADPVTHAPARPASTVRTIPRNVTIAVQTALRDAGFSPGTIDGRWGGNTDHAMTAWGAEHSTTLASALVLARSQNWQTLVDRIRATVVAPTQRPPTPDSQTPRPPPVPSMTYAEARTAIQRQLNTIALGSSNTPPIHCMRAAMARTLNTPDGTLVQAPERMFTTGAPSPWVIEALDCLFGAMWRSQWNTLPSQLLSAVNAIR